MTTGAKPQFPIVDALLFIPPETASGHIGVCTNTTAPGQVFNDIAEENRSAISVLGPLIVSRDGTERMILNSLVHPTITYLILFSEESLTFSPSTNLLLALMHGLDAKRGGNYIANGQAASAHFPNLSRDIVDLFREHIIVLPLFMSQNKNSAAVVSEYLEWLGDRVPPNILWFLKETNAKGKKYYDSLNALITLLKAAPHRKKVPVELDPKDFQHLQPPKIAIAEDTTPYPVPFRVSLEDNLLRLDIRVGDSLYFIRGDDDFRIEYSLMKFLGKRKALLTPHEQLLIGAELNRLNVERRAGLAAPPFAESNDVQGTQEILLEPKVALVPDQQYYYKIGLKDAEVSVMCMAFDICEEVFDLRSTGAGGIFAWLAEKNRFQAYEMDMLHRMDVGGQIGRALIAGRFGYSFIQDFPSIFKINRETLPLLIAESDSFLDVHRGMLLKTYTQGLTEEHGDARKGLSRSAVTLAIYRDAVNAFARMPSIYKQGDVSTEEMRSAYKKQLLRLDHDGDYSYGQRTRVHFGFDQLERTADVLSKDPSRAAIIQRFDPTVDMDSTLNPDTKRREYTHDPCLTHDIFFIADGTLHSFHIARAHNLPNAYPENLFGLYDAYVSSVRGKLSLASGDLYMLSSRGNILLLSEEQRVRKIIAEPSKPMGDVERTSGPTLLGANVRKEVPCVGVLYATELLKDVPLYSHPIIDRFRNFEGVDILERAVSYLVERGGSHNNPVLTTYQAGTSDPQADHLVFYQANVFGGKVYATAVFANHEPSPADDLKLASAVATVYATRLEKPLAEANIFYINGAV
ncbi:TPA: hypothetical protein DIV48_00905 [Candidatus Kaiserbacteria bacterium]|nr:MAG: hypothetical protein UY93_C0004G0033 [Parcubacteria group bacterium GW2011_GWA1_56_13]HCR52190.1 hypothetical protein [Candidatus Kaiserbacteria bacterium]